MKQVILPLLICLAFLVVLGIGIIAMPQEERGHKADMKLGEIILEKSYSGELWVQYKLKDVEVTHLIKYSSISALLDGAGEGRQKSTIYFAGGSFFVPFDSEEFEAAVKKYFEANPEEVK